MRHRGNFGHLVRPAGICNADQKSLLDGTHYLNGGCIWHVFDLLFCGSQYVVVAFLSMVTDVTRGIARAAISFMKV